MRIAASMSASQSAEVGSSVDRRVARHSADAIRWTPRGWAQSMGTLTPTLEPAGQELLSQLLRFDPQQRISAKKALQDDYFGSVEERYKTAAGIQ